MSDLPPHFSHGKDVVALDLGRLLQSGKPPSQETWLDLPIKEFGKGAYSYPLDWWNGINLLIGYAGYYGPSAQFKAQVYMRQIQTILQASLQGMPYTTKLVFVVLKYIMFNEMTRCTAVNTVLESLKSAQACHGAKNMTGSAAGRVAGGIFTSYAQRGGRRGKKRLNGKTKIKGGLAVSNVFLVTLGSITRLIIEKGYEASAVDVSMAVIFGRTDKILTSTQYSTLYRAVIKCRDLNIPQSEIDAHNKIIKDLLNELRTMKMNNYAP